MYALPFSDFEITSKTNEACEETKYKELVECEKSGRFYKRYLPILANDCSDDIVVSLHCKFTLCFQLF